MAEEKSCPICLTKGVETPEPWLVGCPRCGWFQRPLTTGVSFRGLLQPEGTSTFASLHRRAKLSHIVRRQQRPGAAPPGVDPARIDPAALDEPLPSPAEQVDNLVLWFAQRQRDYASPASIDGLATDAWIGAPINDRGAFGAADWLLGTDEGHRLLSRDTFGSFWLTLAGWARVEELRRSAGISRLAFMALKFGDPQLEHAVTACFRPAVAAAGFELRTLADEQPAGLIDDQLRVALRQARFVISDLSHGNNGAYWEAGFAEGAGKPVIYACRRDVWDEQKTHFDTNHLATIIWDPADLAGAQARLTAMIRATLPGEAKLAD